MKEMLELFSKHIVNVSYPKKHYEKTKWQYFQYDGAKAHTAGNLIFWGYMKQKVFYGTFEEYFLYSFE